MKPEEADGPLERIFRGDGGHRVEVSRYAGQVHRGRFDGSFGAPKSYGNDAVTPPMPPSKCEMVITLNKKWAAEGRTTIAIGVGLNTGDVTAGFIGSTKKMEYSVIGDAVNLASGSKA